MPRNKQQPKQANPLTPAMRQYQHQKSLCPGAILLFRMGDFYETFFDDAVTLAHELGLSLTGRKVEDQEPIPLAGIPYHNLDAYLAKLIAKGFKVAISEAVGDPKLARGVVKREIVRIVAPGTWKDEQESADD